MSEEASDATVGGVQLGGAAKATVMAYHQLALDADKRLHLALVGDMHRLFLFIYGLPFMLKLLILLCAKFFFTSKLFVISFAWLLYYLFFL